MTHLFRNHVFSQNSLTKERNVEHNLGDLLPDNLLQVIGIDTEEKIPDIGQYSRNNSLPQPDFSKCVYFPLETAEVHIPEREHANEELLAESQSIEMLSCFQVQMNNSIVNAFSIYESHDRVGNDVVVRDGSFLRCGQIIKPISQRDCGNSTHQIITFNLDENFKEYLTIQTSIAKSLTQSFIDYYDFPTKLLDIEMVSYKSRALLRIHLTCTSFNDVNILLNHIISVFSIPVELYE